MVDFAVADARGRRAGAAADARRPHHPHGLRVDGRAELADQLLGPGKHAGNRIADPDGQRRRRRLAFLDDVEMVVERRHLVDLGLRQPHLLGKRAQVGGRQMAVAVLDQVKMFDQQVAPARALAQQRANVFERGIVQPPAFRPAVATAAVLHRHGLPFRHARGGHVASR